MCRPATCDQCHKTKWMGCGQHVEAIAATLKPHERCKHVAWPDMSANDIEKAHADHHKK